MSQHRCAELLHGEGHGSGHLFRNTLTWTKRGEEGHQGGHARRLAESDLKVSSLTCQRFPLLANALAELLLFFSAREGQLLDC